MNPAIGSASTATKRPRIVVWIIGALAAAALLAVAAQRLLLPMLEIQKAEAELRHYDAVAARARLQKFPYQDSAALLLSARAARLCNAYAEAERQLFSFDSKHPPTASSALEWQLLGAQQGDFFGQEGQLRAQAESPGADHSILQALAQGYLVSYRTPDAYAAVEKLLERHPSDIYGLRIRAAVREAMRKNELAEEDLRHAVDIAPANSATHSALADLLGKVGKSREAIYHYEVAHQLQASDAASLLGLARALVDEARLDEAERTLDELLVLDPDNVEGLVERGRLALRRGKPADAKPFLATALERAPWQREALDIQAIVFKELGPVQDARETAARIDQWKAEDGIGGKLKLRAQANPYDVPVRLELWRWCRRNGQWKDGAAYLYEILRLDARQPLAHQALAEYFEQVGQPHRAEQHRRAMELP
jgi:Tfp pilus assembly protein PilF